LEQEEQEKEQPVVVFQEQVELQDEPCKVFGGVGSTKHSPIAPECNFRQAISNCSAKNKGMQWAICDPEIVDKKSASQCSSAHKHLWVHRHCTKSPCFLWFHVARTKDGDEVATHECQCEFPGRPRQPVG
jgi:hypothetical protein